CRRPGRSARRLHAAAPGGQWRRTRRPRWRPPAGQGRLGVSFQIPFSLSVQRYDARTGIAGSAAASPVLREIVGSMRASGLFALSLLGACTAVPASQAPPVVAPVRAGLDVFAADVPAPLRGRRVGL